MVNGTLRVAPGRTRGSRLSPRSRRGVASVLAMMFLVLFGSLVAAMAIASRGNVRTAETHVQVMHAMGVAETGMALAERRLAEAAGRFIVSRSDIDQAFGHAIWDGNLGPYGDYIILPSPGGYEGDNPDGIAEALVNAHARDENIVVHSAGDPSVPTITEAWPHADLNVYRSTGWVVTPLVALSPAGGSVPPPAFQIVYAPLANGTDVRVIVIGYHFVANRAPMTRTMTRDFRIVKRVGHAVISPSRIMIGKNVQIVGDLGVRYEDVGFEHADPLIMRCDFNGLDPLLDNKLEAFYSAVAASDVDGDNRLRVGHPVEGGAIPDGYVGDDADPEPWTAFHDVTGDGYVDEFDIFINHFDANDDGRVHIATEFVGADGAVIDPDLARLIDTSNADRNRNGVYGFLDHNANGRWDPEGEPPEELLDWAWITNEHGHQVKVYLDHELGYLDGYIDAMDRYVKVAGRLVFRVQDSAWRAEQGDYEPRLLGSIRPNEQKSPRVFEADDNLLPEVTAGSFTGTENALHGAADGAGFWEQVAEQLGISVDSLPDYEETKPEGATDGDPDDPQYLPRYLRLDPDANFDGLPDNWQTAYYEPMPLGSPNAADWYYRPVFEHMVFRDVQIPMGLNALFRGCTFVGVTWVRTHVPNHGYDPDAPQIDWAFYGRMRFNPSVGRPVPERPRWVFGDDFDEWNEDDGCVDCPPLEDAVLPEEARPPNQMLLMAFEPADKGDIPASDVMLYPEESYAALPDPLVIDVPREINGVTDVVPTRVTDTKLYSNNLRFHDCTVVGSVVSDAPAEYTHVRNKMQFTGRTRFFTEHPSRPDLNPEQHDLEHIEKSSLMLPNFSVDVGTFNSPAEQDVRLRGAIIAGVLDVRGNAEIDGALLLTFKPEYGDGPLRDPHGNPLGNPAGFNASFGYLGPEDGEHESLDPWTLPEVDGVKIVGWDLDGDGFVDLGPDQWPTQQQLDDGAVPVPFHGFGAVRLRFNPDMALPDGIMLPLGVAPVPNSYREGRL